MADTSKLRHEKSSLRALEIRRFHPIMISIAAQFMVVHLGTVHCSELYFICITVSCQRCVLLVVVLTAKGLKAALTNLRLDPNITMPL